MRSGSDFTGLNFLSDLVVNQGQGAVGWGWGEEMEREARTERERERNAKHLSFLIQELAALPVIQCLSVYKRCPVQNGFLSVNHHVLFFQRVFCRISFAEHRGQYLG